MRASRATSRITMVVGIACSLTRPTTVWSATYDDMRAAAVTSCQAIDPTAHQSGLVFNPDGYQSFYVRSECFQRAAVQFRDETLCAEVRQRPSLFSSSWGYSRAQCIELVREGLAGDERALTETKQRYQQSGVRLRDFRLERNGNGRDFDLLPSFTGDYGHGYQVRVEVLRPGGGAALLHASGYFVDGASNLRIFLRQDDVRARMPTLALGQPYTMRVSVILDVGHGGLSGYWSDAFIERIFPIRERSQGLTREVRF